MIQVKKCAFCGKEFESEKNKRYCSVECYNKKHPKKPRIEKTCPVCGVKFLGRSGYTRLGNPIQLYCSPECQHIAQKKRKQAFNERGFQ